MALSQTFANNIRQALDQHHLATAGLPRIRKMRE
jgi:hypothetical protein